MKAHQRSVGKTDTHLTPPEIMSKLGRFDLDPACPEFVVRPLATVCYSESDDGLSRPWHGRVWCNPPFNRFQRPRWMAKMADHGNGIMLVPAATETAAFYKYVWERADAVLFLRGRPHFHDAADKPQSWNCGCSIALVAYGHGNRMTLEDSGLGVVLRLNHNAV